MGTKRDTEGASPTFANRPFSNTYRRYLDAAEDYADNMDLRITSRKPNDYPLFLEVASDDNDGSYKDGKLTRLRFVAHGGDPEAGVKIIGLTGNEVTIFEMTIDMNTPASVSHAAINALIEELA